MKTVLEGLKKRALMCWGFNKGVAMFMLVWTVVFIGALWELASDWVNLKGEYQGWVVLIIVSYLVVNWMYRLVLLEIVNRHAKPFIEKDV